MDQQQRRRGTPIQGPGDGLGIGERRPRMVCPACRGDRAWGAAPE
jgi:hypothetical protein